MKKSTKWTIGVIVAALILGGAYLGTSQFSKGSLVNSPRGLISKSISLPADMREVRKGGGGTFDTCGSTWGLIWHGAISLPADPPYFMGDAQFMSSESFDYVGNAIKDGCSLKVVFSTNEDFALPGYFECQKASGKGNVFSCALDSAVAPVRGSSERNLFYPFIDIVRDGPADTMMLHTRAITNSGNTANFLAPVYPGFMTEVSIFAKK